MAINYLNVFDLFINMLFLRPGQTDYLPTSSSGNRLFVPPGMIPQYTVTTNNLFQASILSQEICRKL